MEEGGHGVSILTGGALLLSLGHAPSGNHREKNGKKWKVFCL